MRVLRWSFVNFVAFGLYVSNFIQPEIWFTEVGL